MLVQPPKALGALRAGLLLGLSLGLGGCFLWTTSGEGDELRTDVDAHAARLGALEAAQNAQLEQLKTAEAKAQKSIDELEGVIDRATTVVQRNSADVTVQVSDLQSKLAVMEGRLAEMQFAIEELKKGQSSAPATGGGSTSSTGSGGESVSADQVPADKTDGQSDNAQYWIGASYLIENRPATALGELRKVIENFRGGDAVDEALLDMAEAFYRLKSCSDARNTLETLIKTQPHSSLVDKAKQKQREIKKAPKGYCMS
jgi:TolA-binding protein